MFTLQLVPCLLSACILGMQHVAEEVGIAVDVTRSGMQDLLKYEGFYCKKVPRIYVWGSCFI